MAEPVAPVVHVANADTNLPTARRACTAILPGYRCRLPPLRLFALDNRRPRGARRPQAHRFSECHLPALVTVIWESDAPLPQKVVGQRLRVQRRSRASCSMRWNSGNRRISVFFAGVFDDSWIGHAKSTGVPVELGGALTTLRRNSGDFTWLLGCSGGFNNSTAGVSACALAAGRLRASPNCKYGKNTTRAALNHTAVVWSLWSRAPRMVPLKLYQNQQQYGKASPSFMANSGRVRTRGASASCRTRRGRRHPAAARLSGCTSSSATFGLQTLLVSSSNPDRDRGSVWLGGAPDRNSSTAAKMRARRRRVACTASRRRATTHPNSSPFAFICLEHAVAAEHEQVRPCAGRRWLPIVS